MIDEYKTPTTETVRSLNHEARLVVPLWPDAGQMLCLGRDASYRAAHNKEIPTIRIGRKLLVPVAALNRMLERPS